MNITLTKELERIVEEQVQNGLYENPSEVVRDAIRHVFCKPLNIDQDTPELAEMLREGMNSRHTLYKRGDLSGVLEKVRREVGK